ncbi:MAG TPA: hypothetical protein VMM12_14340 [Longimicrobiales bacterium]|nr:hypothetical protein [Longimicrobiales bacterium]
MMRFLPLALAGLMATACDSGTDPEDVLKDFDAAGIARAIEAAVVPADASLDATWVLNDFVSSMLGGAFGTDRQSRITHTRAAPLESLPGALASFDLRAIALATRVEIPADMLGRTFVRDFDSDSWVLDETRTGAPADGVRVAWYATDSFGEYVLPELGYIDITDQDTATMERLGVLIVRTAGGTVTLADFVYGVSGSDDGVDWSEHGEMVGFFSDGTSQVDVDHQVDASGSSATGDETSSIHLSFTGPEGVYRWNLDGSWDQAAGTYDESLVVSLTRDDAATILDLAFAPDGTATGSLTSRGVTIALISLANQVMDFTRPGGGSFNAEQTSQLETLVLTMVLYGYFALTSTPFVGF